MRICEGGLPQCSSPTTLTNWSNILSVPQPVIRNVTRGKMESPVWRSAGPINLWKTTGIAMIVRKSATNATGRGKCVSIAVRLICSAIHQMGNASVLTHSNSFRTHQEVANSVSWVIEGSVSWWVQPVHWSNSFWLRGVQTCQLQRRVHSWLSWQHNGVKFL